METDKIAHRIYQARTATGSGGTRYSDAALANKICECAAEIAAINDNNRSADPMQQLYLFLKAVTALPAPDPES